MDSRSMCKLLIKKKNVGVRLGILITWVVIEFLVISIGLLILGAYNSLIERFTLAITGIC